MNTNYRYNVGQAGVGRVLKVRKSVEGDERQYYDTLRASGHNFADLNSNDQTLLETKFPKYSQSLTTEVEYRSGLRLFQDEQQCVHVYHKDRELAQLKDTTLTYKTFDRQEGNVELKCGDIQQVISPDGSMRVIRSKKFQVTSQGSDPSDRPHTSDYDNYLIFQTTTAGELTACEREVGGWLGGGGMWAPGPVVTTREYAAKSAADGSYLADVGPGKTLSLQPLVSQKWVLGPIESN